MDGRDYSDETEYDRRKVRVWESTGLGICEYGLESSTSERNNRDRRLERNLGVP